MNLTIGYTLPYLQSQSPAFDIRPVMECQRHPMGNMYNKANSNRDGLWYGSDVVATRSSSVGFNEISSLPRVLRTYVSIDTSTVTSSSGGGDAGTGAGSKNSVSAAWVAVVAVVGVVAAAL